ncbi:MAG: DUF2442 domain-containing protein [Methylophilaceae bacterium]
MKKTILPRIESLEVKLPASLVLVWSSGDVTPINLAKTIARISSYAPLQDAASFAQAKIERWGHAVVWSDEIDMGADGLWAEAMRQNPAPDPVAEFDAWKVRNQLSLTTAAHALGVTRRTVSAYFSGMRPIPKTVLLACKGWEAQRRAE